MRQNHTDITIVLDRSGSMAGVVNDTIGGFNRFLADQKAAPGSAVISLHQFDNEYETLFKGKEIKSADELTTKTFVPRGGTALLDAIGRSIIDTGARIEVLPEDQRPAKVVFVIITDGFENASSEYNHAKVFEMIEHQKTKYSWEFVFMGANQDAIKTASRMGIGGQNAMTYAANTVGTQSAFNAASSNLRSMRSGQSVNMSFSAKQRAEQKEAGAVES